MYSAYCSLRNVTARDVERDRDVGRLLVAQHVDQHRGEAVDGVRDLARGGREVLDGQGEERAVGHRVAVDEQQPAGAARGRRARPARAVAERLRRAGAEVVGGGGVTSTSLCAATDARAGRSGGPPSATAWRRCGVRRRRGRSAARRPRSPAAGTAPRPGTRRRGAGRARGRRRGRRRHRGRRPPSAPDVGDAPSSAREVATTSRRRPDDGTGRRGSTAATTGTRRRTGTAGGHGRRQHEAAGRRWRGGRTGPARSGGGSAGPPGALRRDSPARRRRSVAVAATRRSTSGVNPSRARKRCISRADGGAPLRIWSAPAALGEAGDAGEQRPGHAVPAQRRR